jgi:hypothetical protein
VGTNRRSILLLPLAIPNQLTVQYAIQQLFYTSRSTYNYQYTPTLDLNTDLKLSDVERRLVKLRLNQSGGRHDEHVFFIQADQIIRKALGEWIDQYGEGPRSSRRCVSLP